MEMHVAQTFTKTKSPLPLSLLLRLNGLLKKSVFSRKFYQEINDKVLSKSSSVDANLYFICYFTLLLSAILNNKPKIVKFINQQKINVIKLINRNFNTSFSTDEAIKEKVSASVDSKTYQSKLAVHLKAISSYIADVRIFNRLTESIKYMPWIIDEFASMTNPASAVPKFDRIINFLQSINCLVLELFEHAGWLTDHNWVGTSDNDGWSMFTYVWCSRVWGAYLVIEVLELLRRTPFAKWDKNWRLAVFKQAIQLPLVVHWSLYEGCLTPFWVGVCGSGASWWGFRDMWSSIDLS
ncbi:uncharacterized protein CXQ87_003142 [Candidozyma duobushaemuli]|uniref:Uncharacterized protein n=2 Tax=Candidozyma TaxID=3303203 RepID=A0ABX8ICV4_9ASCO|nr:uncharacterized protein CXQ87_003142 [[Candida] duobushaemulonis]PVH15304.1 hypothetical protein CXQ87_003142 [[Candida] duobushaemulonis]QWU88541.1 hypothetical protein CA3LBN_002849 [[Candida] haemuloni]